jgi:hypothetical protein
VNPKKHTENMPKQSGNMPGSAMNPMYNAPRYLAIGGACVCDVCSHFAVSTGMTPEQAMAQTG